MVEGMYTVSKQEGMWSTESQTATLLGIDRINDKKLLIMTIILLQGLKDVMDAKTLMGR